MKKKLILGVFFLAFIIGIVNLQYAQVRAGCVSCSNNSACLTMGCTGSCEGGCCNGCRATNECNTDPQCQSGLCCSTTNGTCIPAPCPTGCSYAWAGSSCPAGTMGLIITACNGLCCCPPGASSSTGGGFENCIPPGCKKNTPGCSCPSSNPPPS